MPPPAPVETERQEREDLFYALAGFLSMALVGWGVTCQVMLVRLLPMTGLGRILSIPFGVLVSLLVAVAFFFGARRLRSFPAVAVVFGLALVLVTWQAVAGHPQDFGGTAAEKLWTLVKS